jgi:hypothetical protein
MEDVWDIYIWDQPRETMVNEELIIINIIISCKQICRVLTLDRILVLMNNILSPTSLSMLDDPSAIVP